jgi:hypothetical protein
MKGTALEGLNKEMLEKFIGSFQQLPEYGFKITNLQTTVEPPLLIVIPIAIYI